MLQKVHFRSAAGNEGAHGISASSGRWGKKNRKCSAKTDNILATEN